MKMSASFRLKGGITMTEFSLIPFDMRLLLCGFLFLVSLISLFLCIYVRFSGEKSIADIAVFVLGALLVSLLRPAREELVISFPWLMIALLIAAILARAVYRFVSVYRRRRNRITNDSIREALDNLDTGISFNGADGKTILVNRAMSDVLSAIPQISSDIEIGFSAFERIPDEKELFRLPDGTVRRLDSTLLRDENVTEFTVQNVTELYNSLERLRHENNQLRLTNLKLRRMYSRLADRIREEETLAIKMQVHNDIGSSLIAISGLIDGSDSDAEAQIAKLREAVSYFSGGEFFEPDSFEAAVKKAAEIGVRLRLEGYLPRERELASIIVSAAGECVTNCVKHAGGNAVKVVIREYGKLCNVTISNNGRPPEGDVREGGGLSSLRRKIERAGGEMHIATDPNFALIIVLPEEPEI